MNNWTKPEKALETLCAFANTKGGTLYIGISDGGEVKGVNVDNEFIRNITEKITSKLGIYQEIHVTERIIYSLKSLGLPEPEFKEEMDGFSVRFYKDIYTEENLREMGLNERQIRAIMYLKIRAKITNKEYQELNLVSKPSATRDLQALVELGLLEQQGTTGKGTFYVLVKSPLTAQRTHKGFTKDSKE